MSNFITPTLPANLPENWTETQYVAPQGAQVGLSEQHGYNYLMNQVNKSHTAINELAKALSTSDNILDNWYFGDMVNRQDRYVALTDTDYYATEDMEELVDVAKVDTYVNVTDYQHGTVWVDGTMYYVYVSECYSGYTQSDAVSYSFDRWLLRNATVRVDGNQPGIVLRANTAGTVGTFRQPVVNPIRLGGMQLTASVLVTNIAGTGTSYLKVYKAQLPGEPSPVELASVALSKGLNTVTFTPPTDIGMYTWTNLLVSIEVGAGQTLRLLAAKLQIGATSTLAFKNEAGAWVLRDMANKVIETVKCNGVPLNMGGQGMIVTPADIGLSTANVLANAEVIEDE